MWKIFVKSLGTEFEHTYIIRDPVHSFANLFFNLLMTNLNYYELRSRAVAIVYHYVRPPVNSLPYFKFLHIDDFRKQLIWLKNNFSFPSVDQFLDTCHSRKRWTGVLLTFDDGLSEHHDYVLPILKELGLWGIFYVATGPMNTRIMLDVHRVHLLLGRLGGANALKLLGDIMDIYNGNID